MTSSLSSNVTTTYNWRVRQATRERLIIPILNPDGSPKDVTGFTVDAKVKTVPGGAVLYTWPTDDIDIDGTGLALTIPAAVSALWTWHGGWYRVKLTDPASPAEDPSVSRVLQGAIFIDLD
jgi:hypothetical protein